MTGEVVGLEEVAPQPLGALTFDKGRFGLFLFGGALMLLINFGDPAVGVINIPLSFFLKDRLHLQAHEQAVFRIWIAIPLFASFAFGFLRDRWSPFGWGDRGHLMVFGVVTALIYASAALLMPSYAVLMTVMLLATAVFQMVLGAGSGLIASIGQQRAMAGQMSILFGIAATAPQLISNLAGGALSDLLEGKGATLAAQVIFLIAAALLASVALLALLRPRALFDAAPVERPESHFFQDIGRLLKHWAVYPVILIKIYRQQQFSAWRSRTNAAVPYVGRAPRHRLRVGRLERGVLRLLRPRCSSPTASSASGSSFRSCSGSASGWPCSRWSRCSSCTRRWARSSRPAPWASSAASPRRR